ncbi:transcriptional regulator [Streptomyces sp. AB3(2024)]|uniref:MmyB family transcriptional regulator n=1 Tax=Streptomyces sp. AB3(2024) TaxID=3317321 RepID=UPI0035A27C0A
MGRPTDRRTGGVAHGPGWPAGADARVPPGKPCPGVRPRATGSDRDRHRRGTRIPSNEAERAHLYDLARAATPPDGPTVTASRVRPTILRMLDSMTGVPAYVRNGRFDILAANVLGRALYAPVFDSPLFARRGPVNTARFLFPDPASRDFRTDWDKAADDVVAFLRGETGRAPHDRALTDLIGELTTKSAEFARRWARHDVRFHRAGIKHLHHPSVGDLTLPYEAMDLPADPGPRIDVYTPEPDSHDQEAIGLLAGRAGAGTVAASGND